MKSEIRINNQRQLIVRMITILIMSAILVQLVPSCIAVAAKVITMSVSEKELYLNKDNHRKVKSRYLFSLKNKPSDFSDYSVKWSVRNAKIATVSQKGLVVARGAGSTYVYCEIKKTKPNITRYVLKALVVVKANAKTVSISNCPEENTMDVGSSFKFIRTMQAKNGGKATDKTMWESSDPSVISIDNRGYSTAVGPGVATIQAKAYDTIAGKKHTTAVSDKVTVTVKNTLKNIELVTPWSFRLTFGSRLAAELRPSDIVVTSVVNRANSSVKQVTKSEDGTAFVVELYEAMKNTMKYSIDVLKTYNTTLTASYGKPAKISLNAYNDNRGERFLIEGAIYDAKGNDVTQLYKDSVEFESGFDFEYTESQPDWDDIVGMHSMMEFGELQESARLFAFYYDGGEGIEAELELGTKKEELDSLFEKVTVHSFEYGEPINLVSGLSEKVSGITYTYYKKTGDTFEQRNTGMPVAPGDYAVKIFAKDDNEHVFEESEQYPFSIKKKSNSIRITDVLISMDDDWNYIVLPTVEATYGVPTYSYSTSDGQLNEEGQPSSAGQYTLKATIPESEYYTEASDSMDFLLKPPESYIKIEEPDNFDLVGNEDESSESPLASPAVTPNASPVGNEIHQTIFDNRFVSIENAEMIKFTKDGVRVVEAQNGKTSYSLDYSPELRKGISIIVSLPDAISKKRQPSMEFDKGSDAVISMSAQGKLSCDVLKVDGNVEISGGIAEIKAIKVTSPNSLYFDDVKLKSTIKTEKEGHVVFSSLKKGSNVKVKMNGSNDLMEIATKKENMTVVSGEEAKAVLKGANGVKTSYYGSAKRVLDTILPLLGESESSATMTLKEDAKISGKLKIPENLVMISKSNAKLTADNGVFPLNNEGDNGEEGTASSRNETPKTGDDVTIIIWYLIAFAVSFGMLGSVVCMSKRQELQ